MICFSTFLLPATSILRGQNVETYFSVKNISGEVIFVLISLLQAGPENALWLWEKSVVTLLFLLQLFYHLPWKRTILLPSIKCTTMSMLVERPDDGKKEGHFLNHFSSGIFPTLCKTQYKKCSFNVQNSILGKSQLLNCWAQIQCSLRIF